MRRKQLNQQNNRCAIQINLIKLECKIKVSMLKLATPGGVHETIAHYKLYFRENLPKEKKNWRGSVVCKHTHYEGTSVYTTKSCAVLLCASVIHFCGIIQSNADLLPLVRYALSQIRTYLQFSSEALKRGQLFLLSRPLQFLVYK